MASDTARSAPRRRQRVRMGLAYDGAPSDETRIVDALLMEGRAPEGAVDRATAERVLDLLSELELPDVVAKIVEGGERLAEQIHSEAARALQEVVQNAEDQRAGWVRFALRRGRRGAELLIAHDGSRVDFGDVLAMTFPLVSRSREDPERIGRFGIGLKTLNQFGSRLAVHCPPLPGFALQDGCLSRVEDAAAVPHFWDPTRRQTLFVLSIRDDRFDGAFFEQTLREWDASALVFLRHVRSVSLVDLPTGREQVSHSLSEVRRETVELGLPRALRVERIELRDGAARRRWWVYRVRYPVPQYMRRTNKALGSTVAFAAAVSDRPGFPSLFAGLPLDQPSDELRDPLPFALEAPFDVNVERTATLNHNRWNDWLLDRCGDLVAAAAEHAFAVDPRSGWQWVPTSAESTGAAGSWLADRVDVMCARIARRVRERVRLHIDEEAVRFADLLVEDEPLSKLFSMEELRRLYRETLPSWSVPTERWPLPRRARDAGGRWRAICSEVDEADRLSVKNALHALDWSSEDLAGRDPAWLVQLMAAAIAGGVGGLLRDRACLVAEGEDVGARRSPNTVSEQADMLVLTSSEGGLAGALGLARRIHVAFRGRAHAPAAVRAWLLDEQVLFERASELAAMTALAAGDGSAPRNLGERPELVRRLRDSFEQLPADERDRLGPGIGRNVLLAGYEYDVGGRRRARLVRPAEAYVPAAIEKLEGWPRAAGRVPGLAWLDERYGAWLRTTRDERSAVRRRGVMSFLRDLGAASGPRLTPGPPANSDPNAVLPTSRLTAHQLDQLEALPYARTLRDDWDSPDLAAVLASIVAQRPIAQRRRRACALIACLTRGWSQHYAHRASTQAVHHYYSWQLDGDVATTWVGRLASEPWMSTRARRFTPAAPRDLAIATAATFDIEGDQPSRYARELEPEDADNPLLQAIGIAGRPTMEMIVARLEDLRTHEQQGGEIGQAAAERCYRALATYCPGGERADDADLDRGSLRARFGVRPGRVGLIRVDDRWRSIGGVRQGPYLGRRLLGRTLPWIEPSRLWDHLQVPRSDIGDCVALFEALAQEREHDEAAEILTLRRLLELVRETRGVKQQLAPLQLRTSLGWRKPSDGTIFAIRDRVLAAAVGEHWPVWTPPIGLAEAAPLIEPLGLRAIDRGAVEPVIPSSAAAANDLQAELAAIVVYFKNYLVRFAPELHDRLSSAAWHELMEMQVVLGSSWRLRIRAPGRRALDVTPRAYLVDRPLLLCATDTEEAGRHDAGGEVVANLILKDDDTVRSEPRSMVALAWESAFRNHDVSEREIDTAPPAPADDPVQLPAGFAGRRVRPHRGRRARGVSASRREPPRELVELATLDLGSVSGTMVEDGRVGSLRVRPSSALRAPRAGTSGDGRRPAPRAGVTSYSPSEREQLGLDVAAAYLAETSGLALEDVRDQPNVGADAVDWARDVWVELKAFGRDREDTVRLEQSQARRAKEKGERYWLVVVSDLEQPRTPRVLVVKDPLRRLDLSLAHGVKLAGLAGISPSS